MSIFYFELLFHLATPWKSVSLETHNKNQYKVCETLAAPAEKLFPLQTDYYSYSRFRSDSRYRSLSLLLTVLSWCVLK